MNLQKIKLTVKKIFLLLLDFCFPRPEKLEFLETTTPQELFSTAGADTQSGSEVTSLFLYRKEIIREMILQLKYKGNKKIARIFATCLYIELLNNLDKSTDKDFFLPIIIPMPNSPERMKERGFNQCELVIDELAELDSTHLFTFRKDVLIKSKEIPSQTKNNRELRLINSKGCFEVPYIAKEVIEDQNIIIIDDVITTGSTMLEARTTLLKAGARKVKGLTIAR